MLTLVNINEGIFILMVTQRYSEKSESSFASVDPTTFLLLVQIPLSHRIPLGGGGTSFWLAGFKNGKICGKKSC